MSELIPHRGGEGSVSAVGGTIDEETTFYRGDSELYTDHTLHLPTTDGEYVFKNAENEELNIDMSNIESFKVGPIFHLPEDLNEDDDMKNLIENNDIVLLITLFGNSGDEHFAHYVLDHIE